jgi:pimeloyl-ACP methyl ester carboxylesterase
MNKRNNKAAARRTSPAQAAPHPAPSAMLLALEARAVAEWAAMLMSWPLLKRAPGGDGHPVLVLPGLVANDWSTWPLRRFLEARGYAAYPWDLGFNVGPRDRIVRGLGERVRELHRKHKRKVSLVGWSLGGAMARALACAMPEKVRSVVTLGSPLSGHPRSTNAWRVFELVSGFDSDDPRLRAVLARHPKVPTTSILSRLDGVVAWPMSLVPSTEVSENIEVRASHLGMGVHPAVLWAIADRLAQAEGQWRPFERAGWRTVMYGTPQHDAFAT